MTKREKLIEALREYSDTEEHSNNCIGYSEGQWCCLDEYHYNYDKLIDAILKATE